MYTVSGFHIHNLLDNDNFLSILHGMNMSTRIIDTIYIIYFILRLSLLCDNHVKYLLQKKRFEGYAHKNVICVT